MRKFFKDYYVCTGKSYRIIMFIIYPLVLIAMRIFCSVKMIILDDIDAYQRAEEGAFDIMIYFESISDLVLFRGFLSKHAESPKLFRSSLRGGEFQVNSVNASGYRWLIELMTYTLSGILMILLNSASLGGRYIKCIGPLLMYALLDELIIMLDFMIIRRIRRKKWSVSLIICYTSALLFFIINDFIDPNILVYCCFGVLIYLSFRIDADTKRKYKLDLGLEKGKNEEKEE